MAGWCPTCRSEWWNATTACPDCGAELVDDLAFLVGEPEERGRRRHRGLELPVQQGSQVLRAEDGITAVHGADPNWGRIVAAAGRSGVIFDIDRATVHVGGILLFENGLPHDHAAPQAGEHLKNADVRIDVSLGTGGGAGATIWTCDLSAEYVRINGEYRS